MSHQGKAKTTTGYHFTPAGMLWIEKTVTSVGEDMEILGPAVVWLSTSLQNSYTEILMPNMTAWGGKTFRVCLGCEGGAFINRFITEETHRDPTPLPPSGDMTRRHLSTRKSVLTSQQAKSAGTKVQDLSASRTVKNNFLLCISYLICGILL